MPASWLGRSSAFFADRAGVHQTGLNAALRSVPMTQGAAGLSLLLACSMWAPGAIMIFAATVHGSASCQLGLEYFCHGMFASGAGLERAGGGALGVLWLRLPARHSSEVGGMTQCSYIYAS
jgi:hypothetical protein